jgi:hypothetical protein
MSRKNRIIQYFTYHLKMIRIEALPDHFSDGKTLVKVDFKKNLSNCVVKTFSVK